MAKPKKSAVMNDDRISAFPVPFSLDAFRIDITEVFLHFVRTVAWITDAETAWRITGQELPKNPHELFATECSAADLGLSYKHIRDTPFARALEHLYEFAFFGRRDASAERMVYESYYMWLSDLVSDALNSDFSTQCDSYDPHFLDHAKNCVLVAETANARNILEGGEPFAYFFNVGARESASEGILTIRQLALLSGMEEMSIRAAANPKRANPLTTHTEDGGTRVAVKVAKEWLKSKGLYIPLTTYHSAGDVNLRNRGFANYLELWHALNARCLAIADRDGHDVVKKKLGALGLSLKPGAEGDQLAIDESEFGNEQLINSLAGMLELPADLLVLRCKETAANEQLAEVDRQLREAMLAPNSSNSN